jgi:hypothetical protein
LIQEYSEPTLTTPTIGEEFTSTVAGNNIKFKWNAVTPQYNGTVKFRFMLYEVANGQTVETALKNSTPFIVETDKTEATWKRELKATGLTPLKYVWMVQAVDANATKLTPIGKKVGLDKGFSDKREFNIGQEYSEPILAEPATKTVIKATDAANSVTFKWNQVTPQYSSAVKYRFQLFEVPAGTSITDALAGTPIFQKELTDGVGTAWKRTLPATGKPALHLQQVISHLVGVLQ